MGWLLRFLVSGLALYLTSLVLNQGFPHDLAFMSLNMQHPELAAFAILGLGLVNSVIRPILGLLTLPLTLWTLGLSSLIINAALFWAVGHYTGGYELGGTVGLLLGPIIMGVINGFLSLFVHD
jgi:putative membrane protein